MKATLKIEVPDDFKKGDAKRCDGSFKASYTDKAYCVHTRELCTPENCPLELDRPTLIEYHSCETCKHYEVMFNDYPCDECSCGIADNYEPREADKEIGQ